MSIKHKANGIDFIRANGEVISLTINEAYEIYHEMFMVNIKESVIYFVNCIDEEDWYFETTKEEVLSDNELIADIVDDINYADVNLNDEDALWNMLERYID
jgi:hypothetical protein